MRFLNPQWLFISIGFFLAGIILIILRISWVSKVVDRLAVKKDIKTTLFFNTKTTIFLNEILLFGSILLGILGLSRLQFKKGAILSKNMVSSHILMLDLSMSMLAQDIKPSRLMAAKVALMNLISNMRGNRFALVTFSGESFVQCPFTTDSAILDMFINRASVRDMAVPGTSLSRALNTALFLARKDSEKTGAVHDIILFSDGEDHDQGLIDVLKELKKNKIVVYTVGVGTKTGAPIPLNNDSGNVKYKTYKGHIVISKLKDGLLKEIAQKTNGEYIPLSGANRLSQIIKRTSKKMIKSRLTNRFGELYRLFLIPSAVLFLIYVYRNTGILTLIALLFFATGFNETSYANILQKEYRQSKEARKAYKQKDYKRSEKLYRSLKKKIKGLPQLEYSLGTTYYRLKKYNDALTHLSNALDTDDPLLKSKILFNRGNVYLKMGQPKAAIEDYIRSIKLNPKNYKAKKNLEIAKKLLKMKKKNKKNKQNSDKKQNKKKEKSQSKNKNAKKEKKKNNEKRKEDNKKIKNAKKNNKNDNKNKSLRSILDRFRQNEKIMPLKRRVRAGGYRSDKDW